ncbi:receptor protein kinase, putative [Entamoeba histolytica HM-1:IMSS-B]|uniref:Receptor protein kinase, putative n=4 Tax=Entamoeba histolytica TaxID=5759 RepID=C4M8T7_ENTH1|nr:receptor protein kinase, putative [Entamoeba histolytica HM-1:IMSS]EAL45043.1 receptor protein kinase, putative [Entamoeba histolytica HM-1:IMSS]EMH77310.1 receptor protein kinase, putative [Entamoeba histolytica HM-1:IMSS-B]ENY61014.1 receptor protein kinase, putative [Entamoeba histolytica HM-1:IMSS-A]GAT98035.1 receptor protein kinase putative [Entamoeba histolytica]|eukprot:XP_650429.1 receptor protein kinase, putative [Entamoeba histolytica HM-1:IMSS]
MIESFFLLLVLFKIHSFAQCSYGCSDKCIALFTCNTCKDGSCLNCIKNEVNFKEIYLQNGTKCQRFDKIISKTNWLPSNLIQIKNGEYKVLNINESSYIDYGPCSFPNNKYRLSQWVAINMSSFQINKIIVISIKRKNYNNLDFNPILYIDSTNSLSNTSFPYCFTRTKLSNESASISFPNLFNSIPFIYLYFSIDGINSIQFEVSVSDQLKNITIPSFHLFENQTTQMYFNTTLQYSFTFDLIQQSHYRLINCIKTTLIKIALITIEMNGDYTLIIDSLHDDNDLFLIEINPLTEKCINIWFGKQYSFDTLNNQRGLFISLNASLSLKRRTFFIGTKNHLYNPIITFKVICPDHCNQKYGNGYCSKYDSKCICNESFGGSDCHKKCWYNNQWTIGNGEGFCYFGELHCNEFCICEEGYINFNHYCITQTCLDNIKDHNKGIECIRGNLHCLNNCSCENGYTNISSFECIKNECGNGELDEGEECDSVPNCNIYCKCNEGYIKDTIKNKCNDIQLEWWIYIIICNGIILLFIMFIIIVILLSHYLFKSKRKDNNEYIQQQPMYYLNLTHSKNLNIFGSKTLIKYSLHPHNLDFGNKTSPTKIHETHFQSIKIQNKSNTKWMMIIFHTTNTPKFIIHFNPQVIFLHPFNNSIKINVSLTLNCTTKIRNTKIPYTVWFSSSKKTLQCIELLLKNKTIETWTQNNQLELFYYLRSIPIRYHSNLIIKTDAESSLSLDLDELNIHDTIYSESNYVHNYIGYYRAVPVFIKQYRQSDYSQQQWQLLKYEINLQYITLSKLRNPFIVNFIGSVNYTKDIYIITQFFILGSLSQFIQNNSNEIILKLPFKLKIKIMKDIAKGVQFLHYNNILHLNLKPNNILLNSLFDMSNCCVKVTDYCSSPKLLTIRELLNQSSIYYNAPEIFEHYFYKQSDSFSFSIICWELFYQQKYFNKNFNYQKPKKNIPVFVRPHFDDSIPFPLKNLIQLCWKQIYTERPSFDFIVNSLNSIFHTPNNYEMLDNEVDCIALSDFINEKQQQFCFEMMIH